MKEAAKFAETTQILMNVSEFTDVSQATDTLISAVQAFGYTAETSMDVVDLLNTIGNNYAISTADLAKSLTKSSASLVAAGGDLAEAAALTATANKIIQDADSVGTALKTTSLRLRGTDVSVLEEEGLDSDGAVTSKSKLQGKVKALSGVDILTATGEYKSTYEILSQIADVWESMNDMDQAALLELISGKRNSSVIAAILQNPEELKEAFEDANNASGSALKENEKYLDSIQGKIDQFNNAVQTMWSNTLDSDAVKWFVNLGTELVKIIDKIGLFNSVLIGLGIFATKKYNLLGNLFGSKDDIASMQREYEKLKKKADEAIETFNTNPNQKNRERKDSAIKNRDDYYNLNLAPDAAQVELTNKQIAAQEKLEKAKAKLANAQAKEAEGHTYAASTMKQYEAAVHRAEKEVSDLNEELKEKVVVDKLDKQTTEDKIATTWKELGAQIMSGKVTKENLGASIKNILVTKLANTALGEKIAQHYNVQVAELGTLTVTQLLSGGFTALASAIWTALAPLLPFIAAAAAVVGVVALVVHGIDKLWVTAGEAKEKLEELNSEISDLESDLDSLNDELKTTQERMEELLSKDSLSFVEQEELANLKLQNEYLEKQIELQEMILKNKKEARTSTAKDLVNKTWNRKSHGKEDYQVDWNDGVIKHDNFWSIGLSGKDAIEKGLKKYQQTKTTVDIYEKSYMTALEKYGSEHWITKQNEDQLNKFRDQLTARAGGINMVLGEMSDIISENELKYGDDQEVNKFLDEYYAYTYKWQEAQGISTKSSAISSIFNDTSSSESIKKLKEDLTTVSNNSSLDDAQKQTKALGLVSDAINSTTGDYARLKTSMDIIGITADEVARYFVQLSKAPDSSTVEGITSQYQKGVDALGKYKGAATDIIAEFTNLDGEVEQISWGSLFDDEGNTIDTQIAKVFHGADETVRNEFGRIVKAVNDNKMEVETAIKSFGLSGTLAGFKLIEQSITELNTDVFKNLGDDISGLIDTFEELGLVLESVSNSMDLVSQAEAEQAYSGSVSLETALKLMQSTEDWNKVLTITEGSISVNEDATENLVKDQLKLVVANLKTSLSTVSAQIAQNNMAASSDNLGKTIEESTTESVRQLAANMEYLGSLVSDFLSGNWIGMNDRAKAAKTASLKSTEVTETQKTTTDLGAQQANLVAQLQMMGITATIDENGNVTYDGEVDWEKIMSGYSSDDASGGNDTVEDVEDDAFQKLMDYYDNRISANQAKYDQIQNDIDYLENQGKMADADYYKDQIALLTVGEEPQQSFLEAKLQGAKDRLAELEAAGKKGSDEWWSAAQIVNDTMSELDDVHDTVLELQIAIGETKWESFEEFNTRLDDINSKLETMRDLIAPNGEEDWFDDAGGWTEKGVAVLGSQVQQLMQAKAGLDEANGKLEEFGVTQNDDGTWSAKGYAGNEAWYKENYGIQSEQQYTDWLKKLTDEQYKYASAVSDTEQDIADMYESSIDAAEEYFNTLIDSYNDYIDSVKSALDAERDLYDFKRKIEDQSKNLAETERKIASLSGSTNAADIAERRRLQATLLDQQRDMEDSYRDHSNQSQQDALDAEAQAYEESMNRFIENLHTNLNLALQDMDTFIQGVTSAVTVNAPTILQAYNDLGIALDDAIVAPWQAAMDAMGDDGYSGVEGLGLMNSWVAEGGAFSTFASKASDYLTSVWDETNVDPNNAFADAVGTQMENIVENIRKNVEKGKTYASDLLKIEDASEQYSKGGDKQDNPPPSNPPPTQYRYKATMTGIAPVGKATGVGLGITVSEAKADAFESLKKNFAQSCAQEYGYATEDITGAWAKVKNKTVKYEALASGTLSKKQSGFAITDEPWLGDELVLVPTAQGNLSYMRKGTSVVPAALTENLMEWGQFTPDSLNLGGGVNINMINNAVVKPQYDFSFDSLVHVDHCDQNTLKDLEKMVDNKIDKFSRDLNYGLKKYTR